jgi:hypothetical protein
MQYVHYAGRMEIKNITDSFGALAQEGVVSENGK